MRAKYRSMRRAWVLLGVTFAVGADAACGKAIADQNGVQASSAVDTKILTNERIETEFIVRRDVLMMLKGAKGAGQADRQFIAGALRDRRVSLRDCDFHAVVTTGQTGSTQGDREPIHVQIAALDALSCRDNPTVASYLKGLAGVDFRRGAVSFYEHPTTCYDFVASGKLTRLCHYGSAAYTGIDLAPVVAFLKERSSKQNAP